VGSYIKDDETLHSKFPIKDITFNKHALNSIYYCYSYAGQLSEIALS
jgi:hypothetical protein